MPTQTIQQFAGLSLNSDAQEAPGALDALNVDFDSLGRVRTRDGYTQVSAGSSDITITGIVMQGTAGNFVTVDAGNVRARAYNASGTLLASSAVLSSGAFNLANFGTPTASYVYAPTGNAVNTLARWDGAAWTYPASGYSAHLIGVTPWDNRLILASESSPTTNSHKVRFSDAGAPETYTANSYVDLTPGDNEVIVGLCTWRDKVFVFKNSKFFVFYGVSTDPTGQPVFNYRTVNTGTGAGLLGTGLSNKCVAMDDAVYFVNGQGIFRTTGGPPEKVSGPIDPLFGIGSASYFTSSTDARGAVVLCRSRKKLLVSYGFASPAYYLVFDIEHGAWSYWNIAGTAVLEYIPSIGALPILLFAANDGKIHKFGAFTTDNGTAIASKYRTGFQDFGVAESEKAIRALTLSGIGTVTLKTAVNDAVALSTGTSKALGTSPAVASARFPVGVRGRNISVDISATSGQWSLSHLSFDVAAVRAAGVRAA
jgi:hypothetical protein